MHHGLRARLQDSSQAMMRVVGWTHLHFSPQSILTIRIHVGDSKWTMILPCCCLALGRVPTACKCDRRFYSPLLIVPACVPANPPSCMSAEGTSLPYVL